MRAVVCREYGTPEDLVLDELPNPTPGPGQVVVKVRAAAVNYPDVLLIAGKYQIKVPPPFSPGSEMAGDVLAVGDGVDYRPGDRVSATTFVGAFAEQAVVDARGLTPIPDGVDYADAAAFGVTNRTAYYTLRTVAPVKPGDWVVVLGAGGGVGLAAVDIAVLMGARVIAAASGAEKLEVCRQRGAEAVIDYDREDLRTRLKEITGPDGAQVVVDPVGGRYSEPALRGLGRGGRFVTLGYAAGDIPAIPLNLVLLKGITVQGMEIRTFMVDHPDEIARDDAELRQLFAEGDCDRTSGRVSRWSRPPPRCATSLTARRSARSSSISSAEQAASRATQGSPTRRWSGHLCVCSRRKSGRDDVEAGVRSVQDTQQRRQSLGVAGGLQPGRCEIACGGGQQAHLVGQGHGDGGGRGICRDTCGRPARRCAT